MGIGWGSPLGRMAGLAGLSRISYSSRPSSESSTSSFSPGEQFYSVIGYPEPEYPIDIYLPKSANKPKNKSLLEEEVLLTRINLVETHMTRLFSDFYDYHSHDPSFFSTRGRVLSSLEAVIKDILESNPTEIIIRKLFRKMASTINKTKLLGIEEMSNIYGEKYILMHLHFKEKDSFGSTFLDDSIYFEKIMGHLLDDRISNRLDEEDCATLLAFSYKYYHVIEASREKIHQFHGGSELYKEKIKTVAELTGKTTKKIMELFKGDKKIISIFRAARTDEYWIAKTAEELGFETEAIQAHWNYTISGEDPTRLITSYKAIGRYYSSGIGSIPPVSFSKRLQAGVKYCDNYKLPLEKLLPLYTALGKAYVSQARLGKATQFYKKIIKIERAKEEKANEHQTSPSLLPRLYESLAEIYTARGYTRKAALARELGECLERKDFKTRAKDFWLLL